MEYVVCAVFDVGISAYGRPFFVRGTGEALRSFQDEVNGVRENSPIANHPGDFRLFKLGTFDDSVGRFTQPENPELIADATALVITK